jgi:hypothetical protein
MREQMPAVPAEMMSQILDCLRETQRTRLQTTQSVMHEMAAPKLEAKSEKKRPQWPLTPAGSEPLSKRVSVSPQGRSFQAQAQDCTNSHPFDSSRFTETASWFSSMPAFSTMQQQQQLQTPPFSTCLAPSESFDFTASEYPDSQAWSDWNDGYLPLSEFFPSQVEGGSGGYLELSVPSSFQSENCLEGVVGDGTLKTLRMDDEG